MARRRIKLNIPYEFSKYKSFSNKCRVLQEANPRLDIADIVGSKEGDIELTIELPAMPANEVHRDNTDDPLNDPSYEVPDKVEALDPSSRPEMLCQTAATT